MKKITTVLIYFFILFVFTVPAFADVEYTITDVNIDAYLLEDGNVAVTETFTYDFDDDFNGITRSIIPKEGTSIEDFSANENGDPLEIEKEDNEYKIFRSGSEETVTIELKYTINGGVEVYSDVAEFYWPFFDSSNESEYENMTISVYPPAETSDVIAYGYDEAYGTAVVTEEGVAIYSLGFVENEEKGDIRAVYNAELFSAATISSDKVMRDNILHDIEKNEEKVAAFQDRQDFLENIAPYVIGVFALFFVVLLFVSWRQKAMLKQYVQSRLRPDLTVPELKMSLPATIYYTNPFTPSKQLLTTALLELVRKGYVKSNDKESFILVSHNTEHEHESLLINLLFDKIGDGATFSFEDLKTYTEEESNHTDYNESIQTWLEAIKKEVESKKLTKKKTGFRWIVALSSLLLIPFIIFFGIYELYMWMFFGIVVMFCLLGFSVFYHPKTLEGAVIWEQWRQFKKSFEEIPSNQWGNWTKEEQLIALTFAHGLDDKKMKEKFNDQQLGLDSTSVMVFLLIATSANQNFSEADQVVSASTTTTTAGTGTGVGGGGGGSGAF